MKSTLALILFAGLVAVVVGPYYYPSEKYECCAHALTCKPKSFIPGNRPRCFPPRNCCPDNRCFYKLVRLNYVHFPKHEVPFLKRMCCKVMNCVFFHRCSYAEDNCHRDYRPSHRPGCPEFSKARSRRPEAYHKSPYQICTPWRYVRRFIRMRCPNNRYYNVYRYLPYCCTCTVCPEQCHHGRGGHG